MTTTDPDQYGEHYYANYFGGRPYRADDPAWRAFFGSVADLIVDDIKPDTSLDVGCAYGFLVNELRQRGVEAKGFDFSTYAINKAVDIDPELPSAVWVASAVDPIDGHYDLITCIEVIEHLEDADARTALANITAATDTLLLSSTPGDFAEPTHVNVRPVEYWAEVLADLGFWRDEDIDTTRVAPWATLFRRREPTRRDLVRSYERSRFRLQSANSELRNEVVRLHEVAAAQEVDEAGRNETISSLSKELESRTENEERLGERIQELIEQAVRNREDLLRSNEAATTAQAEAAEAKAELHLHITELHHLQLYHDQIEQRVVGLASEASRTVAAERELASLKSSTSWRTMWALLTPYRAIKTRVLGRG
jgi:SAM-dependent methyltransferase